MGQHRSKLDRHGHELLALRRAGATFAQLTRWLRFQRDTAVAATTVARWLPSARTRCIGDPETVDDLDAVAALGELRARDRALRDEHGLRVDRSTVSRWLNKRANGEA